VTAIQRFGGAINLNVHFHTLVPDGVFDLSGDGPARFVPLPCPSDGELLAVLLRIVRRTEKVSGGFEVGVDSEGDAFAALQATEVDRRIRFPDPFKNGRHSAFLDGFSLHAGVRIHEHDRQGRERLFRYAVRPPFALARLSAGPEGRLVYRMKRARGGSLFLLLTPDELLSRLATLVPPPRTHALRYHGVFAPNSKHRRRVVPAKGTSAGCRSLPGDAADQDGRRCAVPEPSGQGTASFRLTPPNTGADAPSCHSPAPRYRVPWAELLRKVFALDVLECPRCQGRLELIAFIAEPTVARRILDHLGLASRAPPIARARAPDELPDGDPVPNYAVADSTYDD
jgi:hypothetical protein